MLDALIEIGKMGVAQAENEQLMLTSCGICSCVYLAVSTTSSVTIVIGKLIELDLVLVSNSDTGKILLLKLLNIIAITAYSLNMQVSFLILSARSESFRVRFSMAKKSFLSLWAKKEGTDVAVQLEITQDQHPIKQDAENPKNDDSSNQLQSRSDVSIPSNAQINKNWVKEPAKEQRSAKRKRRAKRDARKISRSNIFKNKIAEKPAKESDKTVRFEEAIFWVFSCTHLYWVFSLRPPT